MSPATVHPDATLRRDNSAHRRWVTLCASGFAALFAAAGIAGPVTYRAEVVTDVKLGKTFYHNAALTVTFAADTYDIGPVLDQNGNPIQSNNCVGAPSFFWITNGQATLSIESRGEVINAAFLPNQIFVSADECAGGIGLGSYLASGLEPAYPLAFTRGTAEYFAAANPSALLPTFHVSGNAFSCIGFTNLDSGGSCSSPNSYPLHTDKGDFFVYMPYTEGWDTAMRGLSINRGTFSAE